jgi:hypothetical protein
MTPVQIFARFFSHRKKHSGVIMVKVKDRANIEICNEMSGELRITASG